MIAEAPHSSVLSIGPDYSSTIRGEIEVDVKRLLGVMANGGGVRTDGWYEDEPIIVRSIHIGYVMNLHRGHDLFSDGDTLCGLPVVIDREYPRRLWLDAGEVGCSREEWDNEAEEMVDAYELRRPEASITW